MGKVRNKRMAAFDKANEVKDKQDKKEVHRESQYKSSLAKQGNAAKEKAEKDTAGMLKKAILLKAEKLREEKKEKRNVANKQERMDFWDTKQKLSPSEVRKKKYRESWNDATEQKGKALAKEQKAVKAELK